ncbi:MAG: glycosyltransferase [Deltaproteobacteria bacterium]|nr:glycosyltransferase [Deltaproteobacteria bacterium]
MQTNYPQRAVVQRKAFLSSSLVEHEWQLLPYQVVSPEMLEKTLAWQESFANSLPKPIWFSIVAFVSVKERWLFNSFIESLACQSYLFFELIIVAPVGEQEQSMIKAVLAEHQLTARIVRSSCVVDLKNLNDILPYVYGDYVVFCDERSLFDPRSLLAIAKEAISSQVDLIYFNEVDLDGRPGGRASEYVRRDELSPYSVATSCLCGETVCLRRDYAENLIRQVHFSYCPFYLIGWLAALNVCAQKNTYRAIRLGLIVVASPNAYYLSRYREISETIGQSILAYLSARGLTAEKIEVYIKDRRLYTRPILKSVEGSIQVVIPFHNKPDLTIKAVESVIKQNCIKDIEITLVNNNSNAESLAALNSYLAALSPNVKLSLISKEGYFNFAAINNFGIRQSNSPYVVLMNNDVELIASNTLDIMRSWIKPIDIGIVGAKLLYENGKVQHAGISFAAVRPLNVTRDEQFSFLTRETNGACFALAMIKRDLLNDLKGLDEYYCPNGFGDALFCYSALIKKRRTVFVAEAQAIHRESISRGQIAEEIELFEMNSLGLTINDLFDDFSSLRQPSILKLRGSNQPALHILCDKLSNVWLLGKLLNKGASFIVKTGRQLKNARS